MSIASILPVFALAAGFTAAFPRPLPAPGIEQSRVEAVVSDRNAALSRCYEGGLQRNAKLQGNVAVEMDVQESGLVLEAKSIKGTTLGDKEAVACVVGVMKTLDFGKQDQPQTVKYTVRFVHETPKQEE
jgi:hypothetical protein